MENIPKLVLAFLEFLDDQQRSPDLSPDAIESLEVATQCLESAYKISIRDVEKVKELNLPAKLLPIFDAGLKTFKNKPEVSQADKEAAEKLKEKGNNCMKIEIYDEAIESYNRALKLDPNNAVYYCNRAAAYSQLGQHQKSLEDCEHAIVLDPLYAKAYGRKGLAFSALNQQKEAISCYKKAVELDPSNESYKENLKKAEQSIKGVNPSTANQAPGMAGLGGAMGGFMQGFNMDNFNITSLMNNPAFMDMASSLLTNPQMQSMMSNLMSGGARGGAESNSETNPEAQGATPGGGGFERLLQAGQQWAQQMQENNPQLVETLRQQMQSTTTQPTNNQNNTQPSQTPTPPSSSSPIPPFSSSTDQPDEKKNDETK